jgi:hypothetical protein
MDEILLNSVLLIRERHGDGGMDLTTWITLVGRLVYNQEDWGSFDHMVKRVRKLYREGIRSGKIRSE